MVIARPSKRANSANNSVAQDLWERLLATIPDPGKMGKDRCVSHFPHAGGNFIWIVPRRREARPD